MKKFINKTAAFILLLILTFVCLEYSARQMYQSKSDLFIKVASLKKVKEKVQFLAFGNSHTTASINPEHFSIPGYNLAYSSQDLYYDYKLLNLYKDIPHLETILISLDYFSLGHDEALSGAMHLVKDYWWDLNIKPRNGYDLLFVFSLSTFYQNRKTFLKSIINQKRRLPITTNLNKTGFRKNDQSLSKEDLLTSGQNRAKLHQKIYLKYKEPEHLIILNKMLLIAKERNINVIVFTPPYSGGYREAFSKFWLENFYGHINKIKQENPNLIYLDYSNSDKFKLKDFRDGDHLNSTGARKLSILLNDALINMINAKTNI